MSELIKCDICGITNDKFKWKAFKILKLKNEGWSSDTLWESHICPDCFKAVKEHIAFLRRQVCEK